MQNCREIFFALAAIGKAQVASLFMLIVHDFTLNRKRYHINGKGKYATATTNNGFVLYFSLSKYENM